MKQAVGYLVCPHLLRVRLLPQRKARQHIKLGGGKKESVEWLREEVMKTNL